MKTPLRLNEEQVRELRDLIEWRRAELRAELRDDAGRLREAPYAVADLAEADLRRDLEELTGLDDARERIAAGDYGVCVECGADIGFERLKASPAATRCVACQARHEKTHGGQPNPSL